MPLRTRRLLAAFAFASALALPAVALAQGAYPSKPVRITLGLPAGSGPDAITRLIADRLSKDWDRAVIVENRPGGSGVIAMEAVKRASADGHELILADGGDLAINRHAFRKLPYDPTKDFEPVVLVFRATFFLIVPASSPFQSVGELIAYAKANPGKLSYGSFGVAHTTRLTMESFLDAAGIELTHVPFRDAGQLIAAASNGDVQVIMNSAASARPGLETGRLRLLAVASRTRLPSHPNVPTIAESGGPDTEAIVWVGLAGPRGMPKEAVAKINAGVRKALEDKAIQERLAVAGLVPAGGTPEDFAAFIRAEDERYGKLVRALKIQLD
jgi:tripartite-type tricarboxylate transporter receptor subunit TctC